MSNRVNVDQLIAELRTAALASGFIVETYGLASGYPLHGFARANDGSIETPMQIYLSAGIHGDEPSGPGALLRLLQADALPHGHNYQICPCMNPGGLAAGTRENPEGIDLNRDYSNFNSREIAAHRDWVDARIASVDLALHLHEDWEASGFYLYELNLHNRPSRAPAILNAARTHLPIETAPRIDGRRAHGGVIRPRKIPEVPGGIPEAIYFQERFGGLNYTLESPSGLALEKRIQAMQAAVLAAIGD